jgi:serine/threonine protein kinase
VHALRCEQLIIALNHLHEHCFTNFVLIHRDIKPKLVAPA